MPFVNESLEFEDNGLNLRTSVKKIIRGTVSVNPASITNAESLETAVIISGVLLGDEVLFFIPASLETGLIFSGSRVSADDTVQLRLSNHSAAPVNGAALTWTYLWYKLS